MDGQRISLEAWVIKSIIVDLSILVSFGVLSSLIGSGIVHFGEAAFQPQMAVVVSSAFLYLLLARIVDAYRTRRILDQKYSTNRLAIALLLTFAGLVAVGAATKTSQDYSRIWFFSWAAAVCVFTPIARFWSLARVRAQLAENAYVFRAFTAGLFCAPLSADEIARRSDRQVRTLGSCQYTSLDELSSLADVIAHDEIDQIYLTVPWNAAPVVMRALQGIGHLSAEVFVLPYDANMGAPPLTVSMRGGTLSFTAVDRPINGWDLWLKRKQDIMVAALLILFFAPIFFAVAVAIRLDSPGPILFRQKRVGFNGRVFELYKFRSMCVEGTDLDASVQSSRGDPRVTRVGRFIRRTSLDELPQFFNVLQGTMSVVGPRPHALQTKAGGQPLDDASTQYAARHRVKPGVTGLAQINGMRGELTSVEKLQQRVAYDIQYIENWSTWLDIKIILRTALMFTHDPAAY